MDKLSDFNSRELQQLLTEKTDYLAMMIHQLRTPLTAEKWFLEMLATGNLGIVIPADKTEIITKARKNIDDVLKLLAELSNVNHLSEWKLQFSPAPVELNKLITCVINQFESESKSKSITINYTPDQDRNYIIQGDHDKLTLVMQNLLENAIKYSPSHTTVIVRIEELHDTYVISVTDSGIGIPSDEQKNIFTKAYRASNAVALTTGNGIGLYVVKQIIDYHHGAIWFESISGIGTTFFIQLNQLH